jgi:hypothetical protein
MRRIRPRLLSALILVAIALQTALGQVDETPILLEKQEDTGLYHMTLSERAVERLGLETVAVRAQAGGMLIVPYSAVMYGLNGETWSYISPEPYLFMRASITIERIEGDLAYLSEGPEVGTEVVSIAAAELWGAETGIGK